MEQLSTEKQALGFFGALCGVMVSQLPELRIEQGLVLHTAVAVVFCVVGLALSISHIRRSLGAKFSAGTVLAILIMFFCASGLVWTEASMIFNKSYHALTSLQIGHLNLKILIIIYLAVWSLISFADGLEAKK